MSALGTTIPLPGLGEPIDDAQRIFRRVLEAVAHPGRIVTLDAPDTVPPGPVGRAAIGTALALLDFETPAWFDPAAAAIGPHLRFHCNCPLAARPDEAAFAFIGEPAALTALDGFALGSDAYPDRSTMLVIEVASLTADGPLTLSGPGIRERARLGATGLTADFWAARAALAPLFPRGLDLILTCGDRLAAVPRTTVIEG